MAFKESTYITSKGTASKVWTHKKKKEARREEEEEKKNTVVVVVVIDGNNINSYSSGQEHKNYEEEYEE